ncbi:MAG: NAD(P)-binding domain-containing protein [Rhizobiaceae bacterium]|nr:NAD(P)-binding domain-containing protein [Rhizobiaceae bacterium]
MSIGIIGAGRLGSAIAAAFAKNDIPAMIANSRGPETLADLTRALGANISAAPVSEAFKADIVVLATPWMPLKEMLAAAPAWDGRILIDATNALDYIDPNSPEAKDPTNPLAQYGVKPIDIGGRASSAIVAELASGAKVVKAFNHVNSAVIQDPEASGGKRVLFISGDDQAAKDEVRKLLERIGFFIRDLGSLKAAGPLQDFPFGQLAAVNFVAV